MAGLIRRSDIDQVRERTRIEDVVGEQVTLKSAGVGSLKGLCPFHDERTPSFHVRPALGLYHCFGCGESGDAISFVRKVNHLDFTEAVEYLADRVGVTLTYEGGGGPRRGEEPGRRHRLVEAHKVAEEFYRAQLSGQDAAVGREFLEGRGFTGQMAAHFAVGYAPAAWDELTRHLRGRGFTDAEITTAGLAVAGNRGLYDRFRNRLMWPIRDLTGATVGFGARKLDDDPQSPKYLNTPETPIYHKSRVLYGLDLAKRDIARRRRIVVVEGYTDVMAAHVAGETTAVATCGTAFGPDHVQMVRRLLGDQADPAAGVMLASGKSYGGEIIFTFDGDEAGKNAARKVYVEDQKFAAQTFVAIEPHGWDPCDLRLERGDAAVRELVDSRVPLFEFVLRSLVSQVDLGTAEGRVTALRLGGPVLAGIKDRALRGEYVRQFAGWVGVDVETVKGQLRSAGQRPPQAGRQPTDPADPEGRRVPANPLPPTTDPIARTERLALAALLQRPLDMVGSGYEELTSAAFTAPMHQAVHEAIQSIGGLDAYIEQLATAEGEVGVGEESAVLATRRWGAQIREGADPLVAGAVTQLSVAALANDEPSRTRDYSLGLMRALVRIGITRQIADLRAQLGRLNPSHKDYASTFELIVALDSKRRDYLDQDAF